MSFKGLRFAHTPAVEGGEWHDLTSHLRATAVLARTNARKFQAGDLAYAAGLLHDVGKYNPAFQQYLLDAHAGRVAVSAPHAVHGAIWAFEHGVPELAPVVYGHHAGLPNRARLQEAFADPEIREAYRKVVAAVSGGGLKLDYVRDGLRRQPDDRLRAEMMLRMVFSALVDADFLDTEHHFDPSRATLRGSNLTPTDLVPMLLHDQERFVGASGTVNEVRAEVYQHCLRAAKREPGVFKLAVPTGGGKTRSGLAFSLKHAIKHGMDRVIVAVPFTSITDQTAQLMRGVFGSDAVLEHHSAVQTQEVTGRSKLATQNWDAPLIVTTTVQLLESLLSNRPSRCRKLHNVVNSVIVLDEVQTLPVHLLAPIVDVLRELVRRYGCTVVLSTATQPALDSDSRHLQGFKDVRDIVPPERVVAHFDKLKRVNYELPHEGWSWVQVAEELEVEESVMAIVNTRVDALDLYDALGDEDALLLSTLLCGKHRMNMLTEVRRRLAAGEVCKLVSTQVVEAGVDLDFPTVLRAMAPLDSIIQAAGRCNREGMMDSFGRVVVFRPTDGSTPFGQYRTATDEARIMVVRHGVAALEEPTLLTGYFTRLYQSMSTDAAGIQRLRRDLDYPEVAARFRLIDDAQRDVIIPYDHRAERIVERIRLEPVMDPRRERHSPGAKTGKQTPRSETPPMYRVASRSL